MKTPLNLLVVVIMLLSSHLSAQKGRIEKRKVEVKDIEKEEIYKGSKPDFSKLAIKYDIVALAFGDIPVSLEYAITDWLAVEAGVGITLENYVDKYIFNNSYFNYNEDQGTVVPGFSFMYNVKIIPSAYVYDDASYGAFQYNNRTYKKRIEVEPSLTLNGESALETSKNVREYGLTYGYYYVTDIDGLFLDYFVGLSLKRTETVRVIDGYDSNGNPFLTTSLPSSELGFGYMIGLRIGYIFL